MEACETDMELCDRNVNCLDSQLLLQLLGRCRCDY